MPLLHPGDRFPALTVALPGNETPDLPDAFVGHFGVVLLLRGSWCPYCNAQLRAFQRAQDSLAAADAKLVALSVDDEAATKDLIAKQGLTFPVGHSADARALARATGAFVHEDPTYLAVDRLRPGPGRAGAGQRVLQRRPRPAGPRRRHRPAAVSA